MGVSAFVRASSARRGRFVEFGLAVLCVFTVLSAAARPAEAQTQSNIIVFMTDDQGADAAEGAHWSNTLGCHTPNLAQLSAQGRVFTHVRVNPYCSPTRAAFLTGRSAIRTGVTGVISENTPMPHRDQVALQGDEQTIAETLRNAGYYTILVDKWHVGWATSQYPRAQGFDAHVDYLDYVTFDDPIAVGDEHLSRGVDVAINLATQRPNPEQPYALFFWSIDPHKRGDRSGRERFLWWKVHESLLPSGEPYYAEPESNRNRYRAVVEAIDTEFARLLRTLGVAIDGTYVPSSNTVVFYLSDNGTPREVSLRPTHAKASLYEGGLRVPCFVFGANVPSDGAADDTLIGHVDFYETLADVAGATAEQRGVAPRESMSFADRIGWASEPLPRREYVVNSLGGHDSTTHRVSLSDHRYKLIVSAGQVGMASGETDEFYDLLADPDEMHNLIVEGPNVEQYAAYVKAREAIVDHWPAAVQAPQLHHVEIPLTHAISIDSRDHVSNETPLGLGHYRPGHNGHVESRLLMRFDIARLEELLPFGSTLDDVESAQLILTFNADSTRADVDDTGAVHAFPMKMDWFSRTARWRRVINAVHPLDLGWFDPAPNIIVDPEGDRLSGLPLPPGAPISLGHSDGLLQIVRYWRDRPEHNFGLVVKAVALNGPATDQSLTFQSDAVIRLTLRLP